MAILVLFVSLISLAAVFLFLYVKWVNTYWERRGLYTYHGKDRTACITYKMLKEKGLKHGGYISFLRPCYMPIDLDIIKAILVTNSDQFLNRGMYCNPKHDPLSGILPHLENHQWKFERNAVSPIFTIGKLKMIFPTIVGHAEKMVNVIEILANSKKIVEAKDIAKKFTMDALGSCTFGCEINTLNDENKDFQELVTCLMAINWKWIVEMSVNHNILKFLRFRKSDQKLENYFRNLVNEVTEYRETNNVKRYDIFHYMDQITDKGTNQDDHKNGNKLNREQMFLNLFTFFMGGYETASAVISFCLLELSKNIDVQEKLRKNINESLKNHKKLSYEALMEMEYLDQVVKETLRKDPPVAYTVRSCSKTFRVPKTDFVLHPGDSVAIPFFGIHMDPEYYPDPEKFYPERFTAENKLKRNPMTFLPFGDGPRNCVGLRLGYIVTKIAIAAIISKFRVTLDEKTVNPIQYNDRSVFLEVEGGIWIRFSKVY